MDFNGIIPGLQTRNLDAALAGITIRDDRKQVIDFSDPYYESGLAILVNTDNSDIKAASDLEGKTVAVKIGTATVDFMQRSVPTAKLKLFPNIDNAFLELATGRVDAVVHDTPNVQYYAQTGGKDRVKVTGAVKSGDFYGIAFPKDSELVPVVNQALNFRRAVEKGETRGFLKIHVEADSGRILGAALLGTSADEAVHSLIDAVYSKVPYREFQKRVRIHPNVSELLPFVLEDLKPL